MNTSSRITFIALAMLTGWTGVGAGTIHSGSYNITIGSGEMGFSPNGDYASFGMGVSPWADPNSSAYFFPGEHWGNGSQTISLTRTLSAVLQADPGKIFDKVYVGLIPAAVSNEQSGASAESYWTVNGGTYTGQMNYYFTATPGRNYGYTITGPSTGESTMVYYDWFSRSYATWGGLWGTPHYLNGYYDVQASSFSIDLAIAARTWNAASFIPPGLQFFFTYLDAPPPSSSVPETSGTLLLLSFGLAGLAWARRVGLI